MNPEEQTKMKKVIWAYMLRNGYQNTGEWEYYGGYWAPCKVKLGNPEKYKGRRYPLNPDHICYTYSDEFKQHVEDNIAIVKEVGVDWSKTEMPKSNQEHSFNDSFSPSNEHETLLGTLVLADGTEMMIGVSRSEQKWGEYIQSFIEMTRCKEMADDIFGD